MLMDEPFGALDEITKQAMQDEILKLHRKLGITIVFITHDIREAMKLGDRVLVMDQGKIVQLDTPEKIKKEPANEFVYNRVANLKSNEKRLLFKKAIKISCFCAVNAI